jgi:hypothetical protein
LHFDPIQRDGDITAYHQVNDDKIALNYDPEAVGFRWYLANSAIRLVCGHLIGDQSW